MGQLIQFTEGQIANFPKIIIFEDRMQCPICQKQWQKTGRGYGFVKQGVVKHIAACYEKELTKRGLAMQQPYNMEKLGWLLIKA